MIDPALRKLTAKEDLTIEEAQGVFDLVFDGSLEDGEVAKLLAALHAKGETQAELLGALKALRARTVSFNAPDGTIDLASTGGGLHGMMNVSTGTAFVAAGAGAIVSKHINRSASSVSGSSDVLRALGLNLEPNINHLEQALSEIGVAFLFAPDHQPVLRHVERVRKQIAGRTIINLLIPMANPANVGRHIIGVYDMKWALPMAQTLAALGSETAWIVNGADMMDELSTTGPSNVLSLKNGKIETFALAPEQIGMQRYDLSELRGGDADLNAITLRAMLDGKKGPFRDIVVMNAAAVLLVAEKAQTLEEGVELAQQSIDTGAARHKLDSLIALTAPDDGLF